MDARLDWRFMLVRSWTRFDALASFNQVMDCFFKLLIFFVVLVLAAGLVRLFGEVWTIIASSELKEAFGFAVTSLLTFFIILELFKSSIEYFREHRFKLTFVSPAQTPGHSVCAVRVNRNFIEI